MADAGGSGWRRTGDEWRRGDLADATGLVGWSEGIEEGEGTDGSALLRQVIVHLQSVERKNGNASFYSIAHFGRLTKVEVNSLAAWN